MFLLRLIWVLVRSLFAKRTNLVAENLALRQQLIVIGSIRRECLDHVVVFNESHLRRVLRSYLRYYHAFRTHLALGKDSPLHHRYTRQAA